MAGALAGPVGGARAAVGSSPFYNQILWTDSGNKVIEADVAVARPPQLVVQFQLAGFVPVRAMSSWYPSTTRQGQPYFYGLLLQGDNLYRHSTITPVGSQARVTTTKLGGGWKNFKTIATSTYNDSIAGTHSYLYGLNANGYLYRYAASGAGYRAYGAFGGFKSFKTMAMISQTRTYDTLLMTTTAGALYTIHIPITANAKPVVKLIRKSGWSSFESLLVEHCGDSMGSVVVGIDHSTDSGYQYTFGRTNGTATAITSYGKIPVVFNGAVHASRSLLWLHGE
ncbi:hypothetical protein ACQHIV_38960 [Kribbella sp. GL6]|uniref:hypothetical protein n=1 Tax=Kribbella sp. GL6 TaxID=3419765 RepID=UPI003CFD412B